MNSEGVRSQESGVRSQESGAEPEPPALRVHSRLLSGNPTKSAASPLRLRSEVGILYFFLGEYCIQQF
ncbi:hypothetical protein [Brasilonema sp. UFV-L1]|uniref:hypothetical protein n=1 Tax=Brasilonema sp. UFV-L1 TaxID=2234130 RepID=UPI00403F1420